jgi:hypothetical protein
MAHNGLRVILGRVKWSCKLISSLSVVGPQHLSSYPLRNFRLDFESHVLYSIDCSIIMKRYEILKVKREARMQNIEKPGLLYPM